MSATDQIRTAVLSRIRGALGVTGREPARKAVVEIRLAYHPRGTIPARARGNRKGLIDLMTAVLNSQGAEVSRAGTAADAVRVIAEDLSAHGLPSALRMGGDPLLAALPWDGALALQQHIGRAEPMDRAALSRAIASGADNPTTLAFLPEAHFILVDARDIVGSYEDAFDRLRALYGEGKLPRTVNLISGPSRTADIEQTIVRGAHGPKRLHVVILG